MKEKYKLTTLQSVTGKFLVFVLLLASLTLTILAKSTPYFAFDLVISRSIQQIHFLWFDQLMKFVSHLGDALSQLIILFMTVVLFFILKKKKEGILTLVSVASIIGLSEILKRVVARPRPAGVLITQVGQYLKPDSFPSGHVLFFMGFFGFLAYLTFTKVKKRWLRNLLIAIFLLLIVLISVSRIYLGVHWFSDTLGSYLIGLLWLVLIVRLYHKVNP